jgi:Phytanoyl-CoA dioxygenase (PhyH)
VRRITLPFQPSWRPAVLSGAKTTTVRTRRYGAPGDAFEVEGVPFRLEAVEAMPLARARDLLWREEGMASPAEFERVWAQNHPSRGFRGADAVWAHRFAHAGFLVARGLLSPSEAAALAEEAARLARRPDLRDPTNLRNGLSWRPGQTEIERLDPVINLAPAFRAVAEDPRVLALAQRVLGAPPRLVKDKLLLKPPGMAGYAPHQDGAWWQWPGVRFDRMASFALALDPAGPQNGGLELFGLAPLRLLSTPGERRDATEAEMRAAGLEAGTIPALAPGDAVAFHALTPHRSAANASGGPRRMLYLTYADADGPDAYEAFQARYLALCLEHAPPEGRAAFALR